MAVRDKQLTAILSSINCAITKAERLTVARDDVAGRGIKEQRFAAEHFQQMETTWTKRF
jgi:hypothetical protein